MSLIEGSLDRATEQLSISLKELNHIRRGYEGDEISLIIIRIECAIDDIDTAKKIDKAEDDADEEARSAAAPVISAILGDANVSKSFRDSLINPANIMPPHIKPEPFPRNPNVK